MKEAVGDLVQAPPAWFEIIPVNLSIGLAQQGWVVYQNHTTPKRIPPNHETVKIVTECEPVEIVVYQTR